MTQTPDTTADPASVAHPLGDPLGEILHLLKLTGTFYCQSTLSAPWGIEIPPLDNAMGFVVVTEGGCWLDLAGHPPQRIDRGSLVLLPEPPLHRLRSAPDTATDPLTALPVHRLSPVYETLDHGGGGTITRAIYGIVRFDHAVGRHLMGLLPDIVTLDSLDEPASAWLQGTLRFIAAEARELRPGGETVITRLADVIVIQAIRNWINTAPAANTGWLSAVRDDQIGRAIAAMHRTPAHDWTLDALARVAGMSRSAFSARFTQLAGKPAMRYLTEWRMQLARIRLLETSQPLAVIAADLGYQSEPAFSRAFKRLHKVAPGRIRQAPPAA